MRMPMKVDISNRVAVVTGAAGLIGRSTALALADGGAIVAVNDLRSPEETCNEIEQGWRSASIPADISDPAPWKL